jgi:hypothetical protein
MEGPHHATATHGCAHYCRYINLHMQDGALPVFLFFFSVNSLLLCAVGIGVCYCTHFHELKALEALVPSHHGDSICVEQAARRSLPLNFLLTVLGDHFSNYMEAHILSIILVELYTGCRFRILRNNYGKFHLVM